VLFDSPRLWLNIRSPQAMTLNTSDVPLRCTCRRSFRSKTPSWSSISLDLALYSVIAGLPFEICVQRSQPAQAAQSLLIVPARFVVFAAIEPALGDLQAVVERLRLAVDRADDCVALCVGIHRRRRRCGSCLRPGLRRIFLHLGGGDHRPAVEAPKSFGQLARESFRPAPQEDRWGPSTKLS